MTAEKNWNAATQITSFRFAVRKRFHVRVSCPQKIRLCIEPCCWEKVPVPPEGDTFFYVETPYLHVETPYLIIENDYPKLPSTVCGGKAEKASFAPPSYIWFSAHTVHLTQTAFTW